jgi:hypothetical protein
MSASGASTIPLEKSETWPALLTDGLKRGLSTFWFLCKIMVPVYAAVTFLKFTPVLKAIAAFCAPAMRFFALPGDAALALVMGNAVNLYAAIAVMITIHLEPAQITLLAVMLGISHSQVMETTIMNKMKINGWAVMALRMVMSLLVGLVLGRIAFWLGASLRV